MLLVDLFKKLKAVHHRHFNIQSDEVGLQGADAGEGDLAVICRSNNLHIRKFRQNIADDFAVKNRIINNKDFYHENLFPAVILYCNRSLGLQICGNA